MGIFNQSSSPLSSLMPQSSPYKFPDYSNAFKMNNQMLMNNLKFRTGLLTSNSSDPTIALNGKNMMNDAMNPDYQDTLLLQNTNNSTTGWASFNWDLGFNALSLIGGLIGGLAGNVLSSAGKIGSGIRMISQANKGIKDGLAGASKMKAGGIGAVVGAASDLVGSFMPLKTEYDGAKGNITLTMDSVYDGISDVAMSLGPVGMLAGGIMKGGALLGKGINALGGGTDGMTSTDAILGSSFLSLTPLGLVNGFGGKKADTITKDNEAFALVGSSYTGSESTVNEALLKSGKKYGLLSSGARKRANRQIAEAKRLQAVISNISDEAQDRANIRTSMSAINGNRLGFLMNGGYDLASIRVGRRGMSIELLNKARSILKALKGSKLDPVSAYKNLAPNDWESIPNTGKPSYLEWVKDVNPDFLNENYDLESAYNNLPYDEMQRWKWAINQPNYDFYLGYKDKDGIYPFHIGSVAPLQGTEDYIFLKKGTEKTNPELEGELNYYNNSGDFKNNYNLSYEGDRYYYRKKKSLTKKETPQHRNGGSIIELISETTISLVDPLDIPEFQNGGQIIKSRTLAELIDYAKKVNPRFILRMSEPLKYVEWDDENGHHFGTHELGYTEINGKYFIYPNILETSNGDLIRYPSDKWKEAVDNAYKNKNGLFFNTEEEAKLFTESGENPDGTFYGYKLGWPEFFKLDLINKHLKGGSINVIPDGALHARKHNMNLDGITEKGIPVVSEKDNGKIELQAEIEKEEVIFRLEVTQKLEELEKKYYSEETSLKEKDEYALEAGKLITEELLHNTKDNAGLL